MGRPGKRSASSDLSLLQVAAVTIGTTILERPLPRTILVAVPLREALLFPLWRSLQLVLWPVRTRETILVGDPAEVAAAKAFSGRLVERALAMEGTCTGEHGVGQGKMKYLKAEHGEALAVMRSIKHALDPQDLMNPGKIVAF